MTSRQEEKLTPERLRRLLECDPVTGALIWLERGREMFSCDRLWRSWNTRYAGRIAFTARHVEGYRAGCVLQKHLLAHRVIWMIVHGKIPDGYEIDHINGDRSDNRLANLRAVAPGENQKNNCAPINNTSGVVGVSWFKREGKWRARIKVRSKEMHLGLFDNFDEAVRVRKQAEKIYGFHPNHGRAAR